MHANNRQIENKTAEARTSKRSDSHDLKISDGSSGREDNVRSHSRSFRLDSPSKKSRKINKKLNEIRYANEN